MSRKILVNKYEVATDTALNRIAQKHDARVCAKVRVADTLQIDKSGITDEEFSYALASHFDFVFTDNQTQALFGVEFDEPYHRHDSKAIKRDRLKNTICQKLNFPLLRIDSNYLQRIANFATVLDWLIDMWFVEQEFYRKQEAGEIPFDSDFTPSGVFEWGYIDNNSFIPVETATLSNEEVMALVIKKKLISRSYDPFLRQRAYVINLSKQGICGWPQDEHKFDRDMRYGSAITFVQLPSGRYIYGNASCSLTFFTSDGVNRAIDFATVDLARKLTQYLKGIDTSSSETELEAVKTLMKQHFA